MILCVSIFKHLEIYQNFGINPWWVDMSLNKQTYVKEVLLEQRLSPYEMKSVIQVQILDKTVWISLQGKALREDSNQSVLYYG